MKCDELKSIDMIVNDDYKTKVYLKGEVDAAIAELKQIIAEKESWVKMLGEGQKTLSLELENTKKKLEDAKATAYAESVDAGMRERRLKRSLWLSRAATARNMRTYEALDNYTQNHPSRKSRWNYISSQRYDCWFYAWDKVERKCIAKAEEYK